MVLGNASCETISPSNLGRPLIGETGSRTPIVRAAERGVKLLQGFNLRRFRCLT
jgi:hypothetical protein